MKPGRVEALKRELQEKLAPLADSPEKKFAATTAILTEALQGAAQVESAYRAMIACISALVQCAKNERVNERDFRKLADIADRILQTKAFTDGSADAEQLQQELRSAQSQILTRIGRHWLAAWHQGAGSGASNRKATPHLGFQRLSMGRVWMRLGDLTKAQNAFSESLDDQGMAEIFRTQAKLLIARCHRLQGQYEAAQKILSAILSTDSEESVRLEAQWEIACIQFLTGNDLPLLGMVKPRHSHYFSVYIMEAYLWAFLSGKDFWFDRMPKMNLLRRKPGMNPLKQGSFYTVVLAFEQCRDPDIPLTVRLIEMGQALELAAHVPTIDRELLIWAAALRWLQPLKQRQLEAMVQDRYTNCCLRLSAGKNADLMAVLR
jgi:tetratricopeptide (TPR) repeat protein